MKNQRLLRSPLLPLSTTVFIGLGLTQLMQLVNVPAQSQSMATPSSLKVGQLERQYLVYVPAQLPKNQSVPVLLAFHGGNGTAAKMMDLSQFTSIADREGFIIAYPQGIGRNWNDGRQMQASPVDDLAFMDALLAKLSRDYPVDGKRVFATGISNGGMFAHYLAANRSAKIAAIAPVVGGIAEPFAPNFRPTQPVSVLVVQGTADPIVPYGGGPIAGRLGVDRGRIIPTEQAVNLWVGANGCRSTSINRVVPNRDPRDGCRTTISLWQGCRGASAVAFYRVEGGGHTWPGGRQYAPRLLIGRVTRDFDSQTIWDFLKRHPKF